MTHVTAIPSLGRALLSTPGFGRKGGPAAPDPALLDLPEKAVQFGTGAFLRGFIDDIVDEANRAGRFGGRIVAIGSTGSGRDQALNQQDGLYTLALAGIVDGAPRREYRVISSVSRALSARDEWHEVLACARNPALELIFSNTTEVGITLDEGDQPGPSAPRSFPGKLAAFLLERGRSFDFDPAKGVVVIPCELIADNGARLREIVLTLADRWGYGADFSRWIAAAVPFCDTLVDRIVPGAPKGEQRAEIVAELGYEDAMLTMAEPYRLYAIQCDESVRPRLGFAAGAPGVVLTDDANPYRLRKVRLLNGSHTILAPVALLAGCTLVGEAVEHPVVGPYLRQAHFEEIMPTVRAPRAAEFAREVMDRFANPYIHHALRDITLQETMKMRVRIVPSIVQYHALNGRLPRALAFGFATYLLFMRGELQDRWRATGNPGPPDDQEAKLRGLWAAAGDGSEAAIAGLVQRVASDQELWETDLSALPGFVDLVTADLRAALQLGVETALTRALEGAAASG